MTTRRQPPGFVPARDAQHQKHQQQSSSSTLVTFGTQQPQDPSDVRAKDRNNYLPVHKQEPRDEQGRKRFHGAFTGGFSAGYFNSVGSKEGWAPSQFVSSRNARFDAKNAAARPEDFMDDEDLEAASETRQIAATDEYDILGGTAKEVARKRAAVAAAEGSAGGGGAIAAKIVEDLIGPAKDPIGIKLLRQMGWREGHGVGPRAKRKARKHGPDEEEEDIYAANHTFAPKDVAVDLLRPKTDSFGLGYDPFRQAPEFANRNRPPGPQGNDRDSSAPKQGRAGFGVGVFEDEDEDINVYDSTMATYDMIIDDDDDGPLLKRKLAGAAQGARKPLRDEGISFDLGVSICHDGRPPLVGFELARKGIPEHKWYKPPVLPPSFVPMHRFDAPLPAAAQSASQPGADAHIHPSRLAKQPGLTADARRDILGEEQLSAPTRSVFSYIALKEQDRLQNFISQTTSAKPPRGGESAQKDDAKTPLSSGPKVEAATALAALKGFMPFGTDPGKQTRYRTFLQVHAGLATEYAPNPKHLTPRDIAHEALEFSKAAQIFKPLSSMMASRFTSASSAIEPSTTADAVAVTPADTQVQASAAGMGMYGALTRTRSEWRPEPLLCKRFNVPDPYEKKKKRKHGDRDEGDREREEARARREREEKVFEREALNKDAMSGLMMERDRLVAQGVLKAAPALPQPASSSTVEMLESGTNASVRPPPGQDGQGLAGGEDDDDEERPEVSERPAMDIFKAIFAESDEEESESDSEDEDAKRRPPVPVATAAAAGTLKPAAPSAAATPPLLAAGPAPRIEASPPPITPAFRPVFRRKQDRLKQPEETAAAATSPVPAQAQAATIAAATQVHPARAARMNIGDSAAASPPAAVEQVPPPAAAIAEGSALQANRKRARAAATDDDADAKDERDGDEEDTLQLGAPPAARKDKKRRRKDKKNSEDGGKRKRGRDKDTEGRKRRRSERDREEEEEDVWVEKAVAVAPPPLPISPVLRQVRREEVVEEEEEEDDADTYAPKPPPRAAPRAPPELESADSRGGRNRPSAADFM
ncbi:hypothetical protein BDZ88DRAFT_420687 [Geranomyces variabilis]|nr:hypothetical protein BDZ88DRAFT_420687 [Geranomyces variabilis]KAJ3138965.1 hypothetical protein HDU90_000871 [Geranomyces variabilis]